MATSSKDQARFDARLPKEQKQYFEKAAHLGGYRNLTDFVMVTVQEKAREIIAEKERIIASERDGEIFFDAITASKQPSQALQNALDDYRAFGANPKK
jgi:uncharacterized protein (DUF1778 family)